MDNIATRHIVKTANQIFSLCDTKKERDEEKAVDLIFDFFVDNMAEGNLSEIEEMLTILKPEKLSGACVLSVLYTTHRVKETSKAREKFYYLIGRSRIKELQIKKED